MLGCASSPQFESCRGELMANPAAPARLAFGAFEADVESGEVRKHGIRIKLHDREFHVLLALLERPGQVVTRGELQQRLWPGNSFVEFENGLNNAISRLREALGDTAESSRFIETVPRHGYRFVAPTARSSAAAVRASAFRSRPARAALILLALSATGLLVQSLAHRTRRIDSLAVLPFRNLGPSQADDYFADGMTDAVTTELAKLGVSKVISETSVAQFKDTKESITEISRALGVDAVVEGAVDRQGNQVRITVQLIRADTDRHIWADSYERQMTDILTLQDDVALGVAHAIKLELSPGASVPPTSPQHVNADAYDAYLKGRYFLEKRTDEFFRAKDYFEQSIELDSNYAPAYAGLSEYYIRIDTLPPKEALPKAREYAEESLRLDPDSPESHLSLAYVDSYFDWNWAGADQEFKRAIALAPGLARSHRWYAMYLGAMGRTAQAMVEAQSAVDFDPLSIFAHDALAKTSDSAGQYDRALEESHRILELEPNNPLAYADMSAINSDKGAYEDALADAEKGLALTHRDPFFLSMAALAKGHLGHLDQANKLVEEMKAESRRRYVSPVYFAVALAAMSKEKEAMDALEEGYNNHDGDMMGLNSTPLFDPLRSDPRFQELLRRLKFPDSK